MSAPGDVDLATRVGSVSLANPVMTAAGTAGHGAELADHIDLSALGAVVVKSVSAEPWAGNPPPRVHQTAAGMINSVGLANPGVQHWLREELPPLVDTGATVVASIWGRTIDEYAAVAAALEGVDAITAVEVNISCPNLEDRSRMFAHSTGSTVAAITASRRCGKPVWAKLSPNVADIAEIAGAAADAGAEAVTVANTLLGMVIDPDTLAPVLGARTGGLSGPGIRPVAVRATYDVHRAHPDLAVIGAGGVTGARSAVQFLAAGASAVQVGTATFADPRASTLVLAELTEWCRSHAHRSLESIIGAAHDR